MNLTSPAVVKSILREHGLRPKKRLGQSFLVDRNILNRILDAADLTPDTPVLEIGAGLGVVTRELANRASRVVAVETDRNFIPILRETLSGAGNVEIVHEDFLRLDLEQFLRDRFGDLKCTVVTNLPYYITSPIIISLLGVKRQIRRIVLMAQKEVAQRLSAPPSGDDYGSITVFVRYSAQVEIVQHVSRNVFFPPPDVDSALVRLDIRERPAVEPRDEALFFKIVRAAFGKRRKTLLNALSGSSALGLSKAQVEEALRTAAIDPTRRGETLDLPEFARIADAIT